MSSTPTKSATPSCSSKTSRVNSRRKPSPASKTVPSRQSRCLAEYLSKADDAARPSPGGHVGERCLDVVDTNPSRHQRFEVELAALGKLGEYRDVADRIAGTVDAALNGLAVGHQRQRGKRHLLLEAGRAYQGDPAAAAGGVVSRTHRGGLAHHLDSVIDPGASGEVAHRGGQVDLARVDGVGRAVGHGRGK